MSSGIYSIEVLVETYSSQQEIFNLGSIIIEEASPTINEDIPIEIAEPTIDRTVSIEETEPALEEDLIEVSEPTIEDIEETELTKYTFASNSSTTFSWQYLLPVVPAGVVSLIMIVMHKRKKSKDQGILNEQKP